MPSHRNSLAFKFCTDSLNYPSTIELEERKIYFETVIKKKVFYMQMLIQSLNEKSSGYL